MDQEAQFYFLVLALPEIHQGGVAAMGANDPLLAVKDRKGILGWNNVKWRIRSHSRTVFLNVKFRAALAARMLPMFDGERLHRHHRIGHDGRSMAAPRDLARPMLGPKGVNNLRAFVAVVRALATRNGEWIKVCGHHFIGW